jgi:putative peptidoglycan lipid II flippase
VHNGKKVEHSQAKSHQTRLSVIFSSLKMGVATLISRVFGLIRELLIAKYFGANGLTDAFFVAYRIPNLLRDLFAEGAFSSAFVPIFTETKIKKDFAESNKLFNRSFWCLFLITISISVFIYLFAEPIILIFAPDFADEPAKLQATLEMLKIVAPFICLISIAALFMGVLNTYKIFFIPALSPALLNISVILAIIFLRERFDPPILSVAIGIMIGGLLQILVQLPFILKLNFRPQIVRPLFSKELNKILTKMGPGLIGFSINQINLLINTVLATSSGVGALSWLNYAFRLFQFPTGVLSVSLSSSNLVHFSQLYKNDEFEEANKVFLQSFKLIVFLMVPLAIITALYSDWIMHIVFERGLFDRHSTLMSAKALLIYALALPFVGLNKVMTPVFYTIDREKYPVVISFIAIAINILIAVSLTPIIGFQALALSMSCSITISTLIQIISLKFFLKLKLFPLWNMQGLKLLVTTLISTAASLYLKQIFDTAGFFERPFWVKLAITTALTTFSVIIYLMILNFFGEKQIYNFLKSKIKLRK